MKKIKRYMIRLTLSTLLVLGLREIFKQTRNKEEDNDDLFV
jgi:hypothetical protein